MYLQVLTDSADEVDTAQAEEEEEEGRKEKNIWRDKTQVIHLAPNPTRLPVTVRKAFHKILLSCYVHCAS